MIDPRAQDRTGGSARLRAERVNQEDWGATGVHQDPAVATLSV